MSKMPEKEDPREIISTLGTVVEKLWKSIKAGAPDEDLIRHLKSLAIKIRNRKIKIPKNLQRKIDEIPESLNIKL
jgi:hypothetical protein